jgi:hypothetical protein
MKKTAMQELIDWAISLQYKQQQCIDWIVIKDKAESLLATDKKQRIQDMLLMQCIKVVDIDENVIFMFKPIEYFEQKYGGKDGKY